MSASIWPLFAVQAEKEVALTVTDAMGCSKDTTITIADVTPTVFVGDVQHITCNGAANGAIDLTIIEGTPSYIFEWDNGMMTEDISGLTAEENSALRRLCFKRDVSLKVVKNTLLKKAFEKNETDFSEIGDMISEVLDNIHQNEDNQKQFISSMKDRVINMCKKYPIYNEAF